MKNLVHLTIFYSLFFTSAPAIGQEFLWTTNKNGLFANSEIKVISMEDVFEKVLSYYKKYNKYYYTSDISKDGLFNNIEKSFNLTKKKKWKDFKKSIPTLKETNITSLKYNNGNNSLLIVLNFKMDLFTCIIFTDELKFGNISTYNSMNEDEREKFVKYFENLVDYKKGTKPKLDFLIYGEEVLMNCNTSHFPAEFLGGEQGWKRYLDSVLDLNLIVKNGAPAGKYSVASSFIVLKDGSIDQVKTYNDPGYGTKEEAIRVIEQGPKWKPSVQNGRIVIFRIHCLVDFIIK